MEAAQQGSLENCSHSDNAAATDASEGDEWQDLYVDQSEKAAAVTAAARSEGPSQPSTLPAADAFSAVDLGRPPPSLQWIHDSDDEKDGTSTAVAGRMAGSAQRSTASQTSTHNAAIKNEDNKPATATAASVSSSSLGLAAALRNTVVRPLCLCANQKYNRIAVGHENGFLVFQFTQDTEETYEELAGTKCGEPTSSYSEKRRKEAMGGDNNSELENEKRSLGHLVLDPLYNTDEQTFSSIRRRMRAIERRRQQQPQQSKEEPRTVDRKTGNVSSFSNPHSHQAHCGHVDVYSETITPLTRPIAAAVARPSQADDDLQSFYTRANPSSDVMVLDESMMDRSRQKQHDANKHSHKGGEERAAAEKTFSSYTKDHDTLGQREEEAPTKHAVFYEDSENGELDDEEDKEDDGEDLLASHMDEGNLNLFLSYACVTPSQCKLFDSRVQGRRSAIGNSTNSGIGVAAATKQKRNREQSYGGGKKVEEEEAQEDTGAFDFSKDTQATPISVEEIAWDDDEEEDDYAQGEGLLGGGGATDAGNGGSDGAENEGGAFAAGGRQGLLSDRFVLGEEPIGFYGGGVGAIALQYEQSQMAVAGGGAFPMRRWKPARQQQKQQSAVMHLHTSSDSLQSTANGNAVPAFDATHCEVFILSSGHCLQVLTLPDPIAKLFLDARLLFVLTSRELRIFTNPMEKAWTQCGFSTSLFPTLPPPASTLELYPAAGLLPVYGSPAHATPSQPSTRPLSQTPQQQQQQGNVPCVIDYTRSLILTRNPSSPNGFTLLRYSTSAAATGEATATATATSVHGNEAERGAGRESSSLCAPPRDSSVEMAAAFFNGRTAVHVEVLAAIADAHKNPIASLALHVGPSLSPSLEGTVHDDDSQSTEASTAAITREKSEKTKKQRKSPALLGRECVYVAAASAYATRITLWQAVIAPVSAPQTAFASSLWQREEKETVTHDRAQTDCSSGCALLWRIELLKEFRVGFRMPSAATMLKWGKQRNTITTTAAAAAAAAPTSIPVSTPASSIAIASPVRGSPAMTTATAGVDSSLSPFTVSPSPASTAAESHAMLSSSRGHTDDGSASTTNNNNAREDAMHHVFHLQFICQGQFLFCIRGRHMLVFSTSEQDEQEARDVCQDHLQAAHNKRSRLAGMAQLVPGFIQRTFLGAYSRQAWASCDAQLPLNDGVFYPGCLATVKQDAIARQRLLKNEAALQNRKRKNEMDNKAPLDESRTGTRHARGQQQQCGREGSPDNAERPLMAEVSHSSSKANKGGVSGWLAKKWFSQPAATTGPSSSSSTTIATVTPTLSRHGAAHEIDSSSSMISDILVAPQQQQQQQSSSLVWECYNLKEAAYLAPRSIAQCILLWEHDTPFSATTLNYQRFGPANHPNGGVGGGVGVSGFSPSVSSSAAESMEGGGGLHRSTAGRPVHVNYTSVGSGGRVLPRKVVLDCVTCDGAFLNVRLYTDKARLTCSPAVSFELK